MSTPALKITSNGTAVLASLRESICSGRWPPGTPLRQVELAHELGVSRIPLREAFQTLQSEGLVRIEPNKGAFVSTLTADQLTEIFDLRLLLEVDALRRAIPNHTDRSFHQLNLIQSNLNHVADRADWIKLDRDFHDALYAPSLRHRTLQLITSLRNTAARFYFQNLTPETRRTAWNDEHRKLIAAVRAGQITEATDILTDHLRLSHQVALNALRQI